MPQELPLEDRMQLKDFIRLMGTSPFEARKLEGYKKPKTDSEGHLEAGIINCILGLGDLINKKRVDVVNKALAVANALYFDR